MLIFVFPALAVGRLVLLAVMLPAGCAIRVVFTFDLRAGAEAFRAFPHHRAVDLNVVPLGVGKLKHHVCADLPKRKDNRASHLDHFFHDGADT
ncbi:hypothetical protein C1H57_25640, partial [Clostridium sp. 2-1]